MKISLFFRVVLFSLVSTIILLPQSLWASDISPDQGVVLLDSAEESLKAKDYKKTQKLLTQARKKVAERYKDRLFFLLGRNALAQEKYPSAYRALRNSLRFRARNSDTLHYLGIVLYRLGQNDQAQMKLKEALWFSDYQKVTPARSYLALSQVYKIQGFEELSDQYYRKALAQDPTLATKGK